MLGMISIIYGGFNALGQSDLKKMIAYSSVSHMGFVLLGIAAFTAEGITGAIYQMVSHGVLSAMLFILTGVVYDRTHDRRNRSLSWFNRSNAAIHHYHRHCIFRITGASGIFGICRRAFHINGRISVQKACPFGSRHYPH